MTKEFYDPNILEYVKNNDNHLYDGHTWEIVGGFYPSSWAEEVVLSSSPVLSFQDLLLLFGYRLIQYVIAIIYTPKAGNARLIAIGVAFTLFDWLASTYMARSMFAASWKRDLDASWFFWVANQLFHCFLPLFFVIYIGRITSDKNISFRYIALGVTRLLAVALLNLLGFYLYRSGFVKRMILRTVCWPILKNAGLHAETYFITNFKSRKEIKHERAVFSSSFMLFAFGFFARIQMLGSSLGETFVIEMLLIPSELFELADFVRGRTVCESYWSGLQRLTRCCSNKVESQDQDSRREIDDQRRIYFADLTLAYGFGEAAGVVIGIFILIFIPYNFMEVAGEPISTSMALTNGVLIFFCEIFLTDLVMAAWSAKGGKVYGLEKINILKMWGEKKREDKVAFIGYMMIVGAVTTTFLPGLGANMCVMRTGVGEDWVISICPVDSVCIPVEN